MSLDRSVSQSDKRRNIRGTAAKRALRVYPAPEIGRSSSTSFSPRSAYDGMALD
jgi:hypothetical protein